MIQKQNLIKKIQRKSMKIRSSGRSSDYITPSFGYGCLFNCSYCYMKRHLSSGLSISTNANEILTAINNHVMFSDVEKPNQTHEQYVTYDISCNEDFALHSKYHNWRYIFDFFKDHSIAMATLATKTVPYDFLDYNPNGKVRIRFSLMPQKMADIHEPNTSKIIDKVRAINDFIEAGYDVHINFSPVIVTDTWIEDYTQLFEGVDAIVDRKYKHNFKKHRDNMLVNPVTEKDLWVPSKQEVKISQYGGENVRYKLGLKSKYIQQFKQLHQSIIPWNTIRYIF